MIATNTTTAAAAITAKGEEEKTGYWKGDKQ